MLSRSAVFSVRYCLVGAAAAGALAFTAAWGESARVGEAPARENVPDGGSFIDRKEEGWFWYERLPDLVEELPARAHAATIATRAVGTA